MKHAVRIDQIETIVREVQILLIRFAHDFCLRRKFRFHGAGNEEGHVHYVVSWQGFADWHEVMRRMKNVLSTMLNRHFNTPRQALVRPRREPQTRREPEASALSA